MRQPNGCLTLAPRSSAAKQWLEQLAQKKKAQIQCGFAAVKLQKIATTQYSALASTAFVTGRATSSDLVERQHQACGKSRRSSLRRKWC